MKVVVDANVLFSSTIKKGLTYRALLNPDLDLCAPRFIAEEFLEHKEEAFLKFGGRREDFDRAVELLFSFIRLVDNSLLLPYLPAARELTTDEDDWLYLACALRENAAIWTQDGGFTGQKRVKILTTAELAKEVGLL